MCALLRVPVSDTASEHRMFERLMIDDLVHWARDYKVGDTLERRGGGGVKRGGESKCGGVSWVMSSGDV
jgi:hypothetical protein